MVGGRAAVTLALSFPIKTAWQESWQLLALHNAGCALRNAIGTLIAGSGGAPQPCSGWRKERYPLTGSLGAIETI
jgi:hypothetical protein